ncbi:AAA family ATPase, partial [bacterium]|nr:AAA family ATPase [bacterium]
MLRANFLGGARLYWNGKVLSNFSTQKVLGLFCYLLDNSGQTFSRDKLMTFFWAESPEDQARYNLRYALWNIRKLFKENDSTPDPLLTTRSTCQMNLEFPHRLDSLQFLEFLEDLNTDSRIESLKSAIDLYRGAFLDGFTLKNLPEWEEWLYHRREELHQRFINATIDLGDAYLTGSQPKQAVMVYLKSLSYAPDLEPAHEGLIRAYAQEGKTSSALRQYATYVAVMKREHNAPPAREISKLVSSLRRGEEVSEKSKKEVEEIVFEELEAENNTDALITEPPSVGYSKGEDKVDELVFEDETDLNRVDEEEIAVIEELFVGRSSEMNDLLNLAEQTLNGNGQVIILAGEMGIGKTRLYNEFLKRISPDFIVGLGESEEVLASHPYKELIQILHSFQQNPKITINLKKELDVIVGKIEDFDQNDDERAAQNLQNMVRKWIVKLSEKFPVIFAIDDLQWASEAIINFFATLANDVKLHRLLLFGIYRKFDLGSEDYIDASLLRIARMGKLWRVELKKLNNEDTRQIISAKAALAAARLKQDDFDRFYTYTGGVPLYAIELANFLKEGKGDTFENPLLEDQPDFRKDSDRKIVPPLMIQIVQLRLSKLETDEVELLKHTCLTIGYFTLEFLRNLLTLDQDRLEQILVNLEDRNFLHHEERLGLLFN